MASVRAVQLPQVLAEVQAVLAWAGSSSPGPRGPLAWGEALMARCVPGDLID